LHSRRSEVARVRRREFIAVVGSATGAYLGSALVSATGKAQQWTNGRR